MKKEYDFSKGVKGKFYIPEQEINLPIYLNKTNQKYFLNLAKEKKIAVSQLINSLLSRNRELIDSVLLK